MDLRGYSDNVVTKVECYLDIDSTSKNQSSHATTVVGGYALWAKHQKTKRFWH